MPQVVARYARKTVRLTDALRELVFLVGGEDAKRIAKRFGLFVSSSTLLRQLTKLTRSETTIPRVLGIDDFAFRKGHRYGTILVDLEKRRPIDLLSDRDAHSVEKWLKEHPGVHIVSRDRAESYRNGVTAGAPHAIQVADRWHLLKNLGDTIEKVVTRNHRFLREAARKADNPVAIPQLVQEPPSPETMPKGSPRHQRRQDRYDSVQSLWKQGNDISTIARITGCDRKTIRGWLRSEELPPRQPRPHREGKITRFESHLRQRFAEGCRSAVQLFGEIKELGFTGGYTLVSAFLSQMRPGITSGKHERPHQPSPRQIAWALTNQMSGKTSDSDRSYLSRLCELCPELSTVSQLGTTFCDMVRTRCGDALSAWLASALDCGVAEIRSFAKGLMSDLAAVTAALTSEWSNVQVEGQVNRLKFLKRQMYGRASFDLLRARVLYRATV